MKTIRDVLNYDELKNFGSLTPQELHCIVYKAIYDDYPIEDSGVFFFTEPEVGLSFDRIAMQFGKLPFLDETHDMTLDNKGEKLERITSRYHKQIKKTVNGIEEKDSSIPFKSKLMSDTKFKSVYKCKDIDKLFTELKPVTIMATPYFINYSNETLYTFTTKWHRGDNIEFNFLMMYGYNTDIAKELEFFNSHFEPVGDEERQPNTFEYLFKDHSGINSRTLEMDFYDVTSEFIAKNYNDDLPYDKIERFVGSDESGICLLHGEPGTGKSTFIKHLIGKHTECNFYYIPSSLMTQVDENELANYLLHADSNSLYIIEDCEAIISDRNKGVNPMLPTLLNFSDGIVGGALKPKFILTFNCPISQIDKAILRKGRLKIKYDFKPLCLEKTKLLYPEATGPMPLCDIYNREDNGTEDNGKKRIGF